MRRNYAKLNIILNLIKYYYLFRLSEIRETLNEVRRKTDKEASERRAADQQAELKLVLLLKMTKCF